MKKGIYIAALSLATALAACSDDASEPFYSVTYPILRVEATIEMEREEPETPGDGEEGAEPTGANLRSRTTGAHIPVARAEEEPAPDPDAAMLAAHVVENAPVQPGSSYTLEFTQADGGRLTVLSDAKRQKGRFVKEPGATQVRFQFGAWDYLASVATESDARTMIRTDLTETYRLLFPELKIASVVRTEYTYE